MADLDAELLALAGGDSSDEEDTQPTVIATKVETPGSSAGSPDHGTNAASNSKSNVTPKKATKPKTGAQKNTKGRKDDSEEEGEASSAAGSPNSLESAPMSESEAEGSPAGGSDKDGPIYPIENKFFSEKDKAEIMALSEVDRESILAERAQEVERKQQDQILRRLLEGIQAKDGEKSKSSDQKKRKAGAADLEEVQRKSSRQKTTLGGRKVGETSDAMEAYKRQREQKGVLNEQRKREVEERKRRGSIEDKYSEADADGESEVEWDNGKPRAGHRSESGPRDEQPADLADYNHVRVGRDNFAMVCFHPGFEEKIKNCFTRVSIGIDRSTGENVYRVAQIKAFTLGKPYALENPNGKIVTTDQYVLVTVGKAEKEWPFIACSNSKITEAEFERYKRTLIAESLPLPTKAFLNSKINDINSLINHRFTNEEIEAKIKRSGVYKARLASIERARLNALRRDAEAGYDAEAVAKIDEQLVALEGPKLAFGTGILKAPKKTNSPDGKTQQERLAEINRANRKANTHDVRKALQKERKAEILAREAIARGEAVANPFARVKTRAKTHHDSKEMLAPRKLYKNPDDLFEGSSRDVSRAGTPASTAAAGTNTPKKTPLGTLMKSGVIIPDLSSIPVERSGSAEIGKTEKMVFPIIRTRALDDDLMAAIDMGIDIEI
ncbi:MAG: hypothetical protein Q9187_001381 [Circinaria calcarea]